MTASDFFADSYTHVSRPFEHRVLTDWLQQYVRHIRPSAAGVAALKSQPERFELVPIPHELLGAIHGSFEMLGTSSEPAPDDGGLVGRLTQPPRGLRRRGEDLRKMRAYPRLAKTFREFVQGVEREDGAALKKLVSDDYADDGGRTKKDLLGNIEDLCGACKNLRVIPVHAEEIEVAGNSFIARVSGAWEADVNNEPTSEFFELEIVFTHEADGDVKISSVRHTR